MTKAISSERTGTGMTGFKVEKMVIIDNLSSPGGPLASSRIKDALEVPEEKFKSDLKKASTKMCDLVANARKQHAEGKSEEYPK